MASKSSKKTAARAGKAAAPKKAAAKPSKPAASKKPAPKPVAKAKVDTKKVKPGAKAAPKAAAKPAPKASAKPATKAAVVAAPSKPVAGRPVSARPPSGKPAASVVPTLTAPRPATPAPRPPVGGKVAVAVVSNRQKQPEIRAVKKPASPIKVQGNEVVRPDLPPNYRPSTDEPYMNPLHIEYFRQRLHKWRGELVEASKQTIENLHEEVRDVGDEAERATRETENSLELRTRDRYRKLISKIDKALRRIEDGEYGFCEETGEEIGLERLEARPIATLCLDAQERWEHRQRQMGE
jgi:DnaK suppressor protein